MSTNEGQYPAHDGTIVRAAETVPVPRSPPVDQLLAMPVTDGGEVIAMFEVGDSSTDEALDLAPSGHGLPRHARVSLEKALEDLRPTLDKLKETVHHLAPKEAEIEFGLKIGGQTGVIIARGTAEVNFVVRVSWNWD
jgi:hypothetical protein